MITFTPLSSSACSIPSSSLPATALSYLLQLDDIKILIDCGSTGGEMEDEKTVVVDGKLVSYREMLEKYAPQISLVLLTHSGLQHLGLYPFAKAQLGLSCPVYSTVPVASMGLVACLEEVEGRRGEMDLEFLDKDPEEEKKSDEERLLETGEEEESFQVPKEEKMEGIESTTIALSEAGGNVTGAVQPLHKRRKIWLATKEEVSAAFESVQRVKYESPVRLMGALASLTITAYSSGHTLGGTIWKIRSPSSGTIIHAVGLNHVKERHLDGTVLLKPGGGGVYEGLGRPDLLITDVDKGLWKNVKRKERDSSLLDFVTAKLQARSSLLFPVDTSARLFELLVLLDQHWAMSEAQYLANGRKWMFPLCLVSRTGKQMVDFSRSMMEWMGGSVASGEDGGRNAMGTAGGGYRGHPLEFRHVKFYTSVAALTSTFPASLPKVVLAIPPDMSFGPSRKLFTQLATDPKNTVVLTSRGQEGTLSRELFLKWDLKQEKGRRGGEGELGGPVKMEEVMHLKLHSKVPLIGQELADHLEHERQEKEKAEAAKTALIRTQRLREADEIESDDSDSDEDEDELDVNGTKTALVTDLGGGKDRWGDEDISRQLSFDIFVKGNTTKSTSFFKAATGQAPRYRMFPNIEKKRKVDEFGEIVDVGFWLRKGKAIEEEKETEEEKTSKRRKLEEAEKAKEPPEPPSKFITENIDVKVSCNIVFYDMEGLNDGRAIKTIIPQVNPRRMILVHAVKEAADDFIDSCKKIPSMTEEIYTPVEGEQLQIGANMNTYSLSLGDGLVSSMKMAKFEDYEVALVSGRITFPSNSNIPILGLSTFIPPIDSAQPLTVSAALPASKSLFIGDLKLTSLKARLSSLGINAEFGGEGVLVCADGTVAVRKTAKGRLEIEGGDSDEYYAIRKQVYALHAQVST